MIDALNWCLLGIFASPIWLPLLVGSAVLVRSVVRVK